MKKTALLIGCMLLLSSIAMAATVTYGPYNLPLATTNWDSSVSLQKFDTTLGTLNSITFTLGGYVTGDAKFENQDAAPATITMDLQAMLRLQRPDLTNLVVTIPVVSTSDAVTAYDGTPDFGGTSGKTYTDLSANASETATTSSASDKALFSTVGLDYILLPVKATGASSGSGAGNLLLQFATSASAYASVTYDYTPNEIPEPSSMAAMLAGAAGMLGFVVRRRR